MERQRGTEAAETSVRLPFWLQCIVALLGAALLAGPAAAVVWYR